MRYVSRVRVEPPKALTDTIGPGAVELARARAHAARGDLKQFPFDAYKHPEVREALQQLFHGKCAYCETFYASGAPVDVEHFRPKGRVKEHPLHPGYWWLAMDWKNLLASCIDCNRQRRQVLIHVQLPNGSATSSRSTNREPEVGSSLSGKADSFPTVDGTWVTTEGSVDSEKPLLLDPTNDKPEMHMDWAFSDDIPVLVAKDQRGEQSIRTFGLNRTGLVQGRKMVLGYMRLLRTEIIDQIAASGRARSSRTRDDALKSAARMAARLRTFSEIEQPYSAMAAAFVENLDAELLELGRKRPSGRRKRSGPLPPLQQHTAASP